MNTFIEPQRSQWVDLVARPSGQDEQQASLVETILDQVKSQGDIALKNYTQKFDGVSLNSFSVTEDEISAALQKITPKLKEAIEVAKKNIESFHSAQISPTIHIETMPGVQCWQKSKPIESIGIYVPGGTAPLFSTVLMLAIPAAIAGCSNIILCTPPDKEGHIHPSILYAADLCGVKKIFKVGGAQAVAAMAYGTKEIPRVDKIFGPGNSYVTLAKMKVQQQGIAIDMPAGPSEVMILADTQADPAWVAIDLLSQAEHGIDSQVILVSDSEKFLLEVEQQINLILPKLPRKNIALQALNHSRFIKIADPKVQIDFVNAYAPEHLIINHREADGIADRIKHAGSIFIGPYSPESVGDYAAGTNHTLPTSAYARVYSGVNLDSFCKKITYQKLSPEGLQLIGPYVEVMAEAEQLMAHKLAVTKRLKKLKEKG